MLHLQRDSQMNDPNVIINGDAVVIVEKYSFGLLNMGTVSEDGRVQDRAYTSF